MAYNETIAEVLAGQNTNTTSGLTAEEARVRLSKYGPNEFREAKKDTLLQKILHHLLEITAIILLVAAAIAAYMAITSGDGWAKVWVILAIVVINIVLGVVQESKAEAALEALKKMNSFSTTVVRDGTKQKISSGEIVPGDIIELTAGDIITADARLISVSGLTVEEAALTGESIPVEKDPDAEVEDNSPLGDRVNMVYSGCLVTNGRGLAVVVETGMNTEMGKIANLLNGAVKLKTPLQARLTQLSKRLCIVALLAGAVIFAIGVGLHGTDLPEMLLVAVSLGVAAVPETLPIIVTMTLSHGVHNMVKKNTIIRRIPAVETVGNTSVICSDKTGTLTQNKMTITKIWCAGCPTPTDATDEFNWDETHLLELLAACSNATIDGDKVVGDPTELAIIRLLHDKGLTREKVEKDYPRIHEIPFDSTRKLMTTKHEAWERHASAIYHGGEVSGDYLVVTKGAFDRIPVEWTGEMRERAARIHDEFAQDALRVIAISAKPYDHDPEKDELTPENLEQGQVLLGLVGMIDPPRPESAEAVRLAKEAGIKTVMITGDHVETAKAIANQIGIYEDGDRALTGVDLTNIEIGADGRDPLVDIVRDVSVYARVSPEDKIRIVRAWEKQGEVITMTGDGVNDAPALKQADVGAAMGITGTEVTKSAADMVITDDNFATIVEAIKQGRTAFDNIRKTIYFLLSVNFSQIFIMLTGVILWQAPPLVALQILLINVISDGIPGFFLSFEKPEKGIMQRSPLPKNSGIFAGGLGTRIAIRAITFAVLTLAAFAIGYYLDFSPHIVPGREVGVSMAFVVLSWASAVNIFNIRSEGSVFKSKPWKNKGIILSVMFSIAVTIFIALAEPVANLFQVAPLGRNHWLACIGLVAALVLVAELQKLIARKSGKHTPQTDV
ncbi:MAG: cation-translocating P-type ATPase [Oscillospiraceae bacterium]|nr:cation-translocating P-type ATPase [Oscillospiraceae bacterium]